MRPLVVVTAKARYRSRLGAPPPRHRTSLGRPPGRTHPGRCRESAPRSHSSWAWRPGSCGARCHLAPRKSGRGESSLGIQQLQSPSSKFPLYTAFLLPSNHIYREHKALSKSKSDLLDAPRASQGTVSCRSGWLLSDLVRLGAKRSRSNQVELSEPSTGLRPRRASSRPPRSHERLHAGSEGDGRTDAPSTRASHSPPAKAGKLKAAS